MAMAHPVAQKAGRLQDTISSGAAVLGGLAADLDGLLPAGDQLGPRLHDGEGLHRPHRRFSGGPGLFIRHYSSSVMSGGI